MPSAIASALLECDWRTSCHPQLGHRGKRVATDTGDSFPAAREEACSASYSEFCDGFSAIPAPVLIGVPSANQYGKPSLSAHGSGGYYCQTNHTNQ